MRKLVPAWMASALLAALLWLLLRPGVLPAAASAPGTVTPPTAFAKSAPTGTITAGDPITFSLRFTHEPDLDVGDWAWITDTLPPGLAFVPESEQASLTPSPAISGSRLTWQGSVPANGQVSITYTAVASPTGAVPATFANSAVWRGVALGEPGDYVALTSTFTVTVRPHTHKSYFPLVRGNWPPEPLAQLDNWNFDAGRTAWEEIGGKIIYSSAEKPLPGGSDGYFAWLGGAPNSTNELKQGHTFAANHFALGLYFTYWIASLEQGCGDDEKVELRVDGELVWSKQLCEANRTAPPGQSGWVQLDPEADVTRFGGRTVEVSFKSVLNGADNSNFFLDKVTICTNDPRASADRCP